MNKTFKVVFNKARGALMVVNEATSSVQKKGTKTVVAAAVATMIAGVAGTAMAEEAGGDEGAAETPKFIFIGSEGYDTLPEAFKAVNSADNKTATIKITDNIKHGHGANTTTDGDQAGYENAKITLDLQGQTYTFEDNSVGSGTKYRTQALQLLKNNDVTIENGKLEIYNDNTTSGKFKMLIQNYSNLLLDGVEVDGSNLSGPKNNTYTISNNNGNVKIINSKIIAKEGEIAFDVCGYSTYAGVNVEVKDTIVDGFIEVTNGGAHSAEDGKINLTIDGGDLYSFANTYVGSSGGNGGKLYNEGYTSISNVTLAGNKAQYAGGAVYNVFALQENGSPWKPGQLKLTNVTVQGNTAGTNGGAIASIGGSVTVNGNTSFTNNTAAQGGAIYAEGTKLTFNAEVEDDKAANITFSSNTAGAGSDLYLVNTPVTMTGAGAISFGGSIVGDAASSITSSAANVTINDASGFKGSYQVTGGSFEVGNLQNQSTVGLGDATLRLSGVSTNASVLYKVSSASKANVEVSGTFTNTVTGKFVVDNLTIANGTFDNQGMIGAVNANNIPISFVNITVNDEGILKSGINRDTGNLLLFNQLTLNKGGVLDLVNGYAAGSDGLVFEGGVELNLNGGTIKADGKNYSGLVTIRGAANATTVNVNDKYSMSGLKLTQADTGSSALVNVKDNGGLTLGALTLACGSMNVTGGKLTVTSSIATSGGSLSVSNGGKLDVSSATLGAESLKNTTIKTNGTIAGYSAQFFKNGLGEDGLTQNAGAYNSHGLTIDGGSLTLVDGKYNISYAGAAGLATNNAFKIVFTGDLVSPSAPVVPTPDPDPENPDVPGGIVIDDSTGTGSGTGTGTGTEGGTGSTGIQISTDNKITADDVNKTEGIGNVIMTEVVMSTKKDDDSLTKDDLIIGSANAADGDDETKTNVVKSNLGVKAVEVSASSQNVKVNDGKVLTLVGGGEGDLIQGSEKDVTLKIGDSKSVGYVQLGVKAEGVKNGGTLNADVEIRQGSLLAVSAGTFEAPKQIKTAGVVTVADNSELKVNNLVVEGNFSSVQVSGTLEVATLGDKDTAAGAGVIYVGNAETNGSVKVGTSHGGHRFFLDPAFNDKGIDGASSLVYGDAAVVDKILVGENSYAVIGATDDAEFVSTFKRSGMTWGAAGVKAALFVGQPITINASTGGLTIDGTKTEWAEPAANSVNITNDSVVIADVTKLNAAGAGSLITAGTITVGEKAKAILVNVQSGTEYSLVSNGTGFAAENIVAANSMFGIAAGAGSSSDKAVFELQGAQSVYGNLMQGQTLADAAMQSAASSDAYQYVNGLLTDVNGDNRAAAARFDAAMNPAGTLGVFTTALDRATELSNAVREEAGSAQQPRLWAKISGGKTKLDGLSTKAQSLGLKTTSYGLIVGGEAPVNGTVLGAAFSAGSGDTKNDSLSGKDEFDYYGLSAYAQREIAGITFTGDIGAAWLSSELKIGAADVKNDADTAVYKLGIEGKKAFDLGSAVVTPFVGLDVYHIKADSYKTNHGVQVASSDATVVEVPIGAQFKGSFETAQGMTVVPSFSFAVVPMLGDKDIDSKVKFAGAQSNYNFTFADDVKVRTNFAVNAETKNFRFGAHLGFEWGNEKRQSFSGGVKASYLF